MKGGLRLDFKGGWERGGDSGPALTPGVPEESRLLTAIRYHDPDLEMPPDGALPAETVAHFENWIKMGAPAPDEAPASGAQALERRTIDLEEGRSFWSFRPVSDPSPPAVRDTAWPSDDIDRFILSRLEKENLSPAPEASPYVLLRRLHHDLAGLPPSLEQIDRFVTSYQAAPRRTLERTVDELLASPAFGERWGRHWLDLARYSDSTGGGRAIPLPAAWRYRDYVIDAFNEDRPLDQLIREHLAGDLLPYSTPAERIRNLTATGFLVLGPHNYENQDKELLELEIVDEQLDTIGRSFLSMTIGCARCHDHKFDPIPIDDYYALAGIFTSTLSVKHANVSSWHKEPLPLSPEQAKAAASSEKEIKALESKQKKLKQQIAALPPERAEEKKSLTKTLKAVADQLKKVRKNTPARISVMAVRDHSKPADARIRIRGMPRNFGTEVSRGFLQVTQPDGTPAPSMGSGSGRLQLASWIASDGNPLTSRVLANRIWLHLFGSGLVRTPDNFGLTGELPTHPLLLDHLAQRLTREDWSTKALVRALVLSRTYRLSSTPSARAREVDFSNRLLSHAHRRTVDAETLRDTILVLADELDPAMGGPSLPPGFTSEFRHKFTSLRRSVYVPVFRNSPYELFSTFDFANPNFTVGKRSQSSTPTQSLFLINSPFIHKKASAAAREALKLNASDEITRLRLAYLRVLGRPPTDSELAISQEFLDTSGPEEERWSALHRALFSTVDFRYLP